MVPEPGLGLTTLSHGFEAQKPVGYVPSWLRCGVSAEEPEQPFPRCFQCHVLAFPQRGDVLIYLPNEHCLVSC